MDVKKLLDLEEVRSLSSSDSQKTDGRTNTCDITSKGNEIFILRRR